MVKIWLLISLLLSSCLVGKEQLEIVSYYISKEHPEARFSWLVEGEYKEFDPKATALEMPRLEKASFTSRFFKEGDQLFDVSSFFDSTIAKWANGFRAVLNKTTGRVVIRGNESQHYLMEYLFVNGVVPIKVHYHFDLYVFPPAKSLVDAWNSKILPDGWKKVRSFSAVSGPGRNVSMKDEKEELAIEAGGYASSSSSIIDLRWWFGGRLTVEGEEVKIWGNRGEVTLSGVARLHNLGSFGKSGKRLGLVKKVEVRHEDGTSMDDFIWWEEPRLPYHFKNVRDYYERFDYSFPEDGQGKDIRKWPVPPTFEAFLSPDDGESPGDVDPFATDDKNPPKKLPRKKNQRILGRGIDMKELLAKQGVEFEPEDTAYLFSDGGVLIVQADPEVLELVRGFTIAAGQDTPPNVRVFIALMEYKEEPDATTFPFAEGDLLAHGEVFGIPGSRFDLNSNSIEVRMDFDIESAYGGLDRGIIETHISGEFQLDGEDAITVKTVVSLPSEQPAIVSKFRHGEKWRAVVLRAEVKSVYEELPEED